MFLESGWASASFILLVSSVASSVAICIYLASCYYPGGRKISDVIAVGSTPSYGIVVSEQLEEEEEEEEYSIIPEPGSFSDYTRPPSEEHSFSSTSTQVYLFVTN